MGLCSCSCATYFRSLLCVHSSFAIILMGKSVKLFCALPFVCLQFVIVVYPDYTHLLFLRSKDYKFETHQRHYVVSMSKTGYTLLFTGYPMKTGNIKT